jgi:transposase
VTACYLNLGGPMYYVGLDLHKRYVTGCVLDSQGKVVAEARRLPPTLEALLGWLGPLGQPVAVALEATLYWAWLHDRLTAAGYQVAVAHPQQVKLICHARCKTDPVDARKLADLLRTDLLPAIWIPDAATRARRTLLRGRAWLVRVRTRVKGRIQAYLAAENERVPVSDLFGRAGRAWLAAVVLPPAVRQQVELLLAVADELDRRIAALDRDVRRLAALTPQAELLQTVPGSSRAPGARAGRRPTARHGSVGPAGSAWLKWLFVEAVQTLKRQPGPVRRHYERLLRAKGKQKASVAAARKLCCYVYWMLRENRSYEDRLRQRGEREVRPVHALASVA